MALSINLAPYQLNSLISKDTFLMHYDAADESGTGLQISEFFPQYMVSRSEDGSVNPSERFVSEFTLTLERFINYCSTIDGLNDTAFNPIVSVKEQNNTCYMVRKKCDLPSLITYMNGHRMDFNEAYLFMRPLLLFLSQAARSEILFTFSLEDLHVSRYGQLILDRAFSMEVTFGTSLTDIMKVYFFLTVGKVFDPAKPSPKEHGVLLPSKIEGMMTGVLAGESLFGGVDDFCKNLKFLVDQESDSKEDKDSEGGKASPVFKWVAIGLASLIAISLAVLIIFVLIPGFRKVVPNLEDPSLLVTPAPAPVLESGAKSSRDFSALAPTNPNDNTDVLEGAFLNVDGTFYLRSYDNGYNLTKREASGTESVLWMEARPSFLTEKDGYIYFSDGQSSNKILRVNAEDGHGEIFSDNCSLYLCINGDYLYYTNHDDRDRMYRKNVQTLEEEPYIHAAAYETVTDGEKIYFINGDKNFNVYSVTIGASGPELTRLNEEVSRNLSYADGMLMYTAGDGTVRVMTTAGRQVEINCNVKAQTLNADGPWLVMTEERTNRVKAFNMETETNLSLGEGRAAAYAWTAGGEVFAIDRNDCSAVSVYTLPRE